MRERVVRQLFLMSALAILLFLFACAAPKTTTKVSDCFSIVEHERATSWFLGASVGGYTDIITHEQRGERKVLGRARVGKFYALSKDGKTLLYANQFERHKPKGIYRYTCGGSDELIHEGGSHMQDGSMALPEDAMVIYDKAFDPEHRPWLLTVSGEYCLLALHGGTPIHVAAYEDDVEEINRLSDKGSDLSARTYWHHTPLEIAIAAGSNEAAVRLIELGAPTTLWGRSAAELASIYQRLQVLEALHNRYGVEGGGGGAVLHEAIDLNMHSPGRTLEPHVRLYGRPDGEDRGPELVELLCEFGADPNVRARGRRTAIHAAVLKSGVHGREWSAKVIETLVKAGADADAADANGDLALHLLSAGRDERGVSQEEWETSGLRLLRVLIRNTSDLEHRNNDGRTPLQELVFRSDLRSAAVLIGSGADTSVACYRGGETFEPERATQCMREREASSWWQFSGADSPVLRYDVRAATPN